MSFLTLEDVNSTVYSNQGFWWHEIDMSSIGEDDFTEVKLDFCTITRETGLFDGRFPYQYTIAIDNSKWTKLYGVTIAEGNIFYRGSYTNNKLIIMINKPINKLFLYLGDYKYDTVNDAFYYIVNDKLNLKYNELNTPQTLTIKLLGGTSSTTISKTLNLGYNEVDMGISGELGIVFVNLLKSDFKFDCTQQLIVGKVNKVALGTDSEYLPNGDMIGEYTPSIRVLYNDKTLPVTYDNTLNDYTFDLDLTEETTEHKIHLKVLIDGNEVLNSTSTDVTLSSSFETINTLSKLSHLFNVGGVGRLGSDLTITNDLTVTKDVYLIGNDHTLNMQSHKIIVPSDKIFKAEQTTFTNGENTIQQNEASKVELTQCTFTDCTGLGSVIDCQIDVTSLDNPTDFTTTLNKCTLNNNDMCILHGGELTITDCTINGKISDDKYPYFLYQTDGEAHISGTVFNLTHNTPITTDISYNSCIFTIGEQATINYGDHTEYSQNNVTGFLENSRNISIINVTYYYPPIEDYVTLQSTKGYCHVVSGTDFVFKTNVQLTRGE